MKRIRKTMLAAAFMLAVVLSGCGSKQNYIKKAEECLEKGQYSLALEQYNKAIMEDEELQKAYRGAGIACMKLADFERAEDLFVRGLKETDGIISATELDLSYYLGEAQINLEKYEDAVTTYSNILEYDEDETDAYFYRGCAYLMQEKNDKAQKDFQRAAKDGNLECLYGIYEIYAQRGSEEGMKYLEQLTEEKLESAQDYYTAGKAYAALGKEEKAEEYLKKSEKEGVSEATFYLGTMYDEKGDYETARAYYNSYRKKAGLSFGEYHTVVQCMMKQGDYTAALELNSSMSENAGKSEVQALAFERIVLYEESGDYETACQEAQNYVEQYPEDEEGKKEYEFLQSR